MKYKKIPNNDDAIELDGKVILSFDSRYKEYLKWREENPELEKQLVTELNRVLKNKELFNNGSPHKNSDIWIWYNEDGVKVLECEMDGDNKNGVETCFFEDGNIY